MSTPHFVAGLDAGGSKTRLLAECENDPERIDRHGPAVNPQLDGVDESARILAALVQETIQPHCPIGRLSICAGVAGAGRSDEQEALASRLYQGLAAAADVLCVEVVHDACIALDAAFGAESGLVIIAGTGSVVFARAEDGTTRRVGGWGSLLGDAGSGYAVGRAGLRAVAAAFDGGEDTSIRARVDDQYGIAGREALIRKVYRDEFAVQNVAPLVIDAAADGDPVAADILTSQAADLVQQVEWLVGGEDSIASRIALLGGMVQNKPYAQVLRRVLRDRIPDWSVKVLSHEPVVGALRRARRVDD